MRKSKKKRREEEQRAERAAQAGAKPRFDGVQGRIVRFGDGYAIELPPIIQPVSLFPNQTTARRSERDSDDGFEDFDDFEDWD